MARRKKKQIWTPEDRARLEEVGRNLADRINYYRSRRGLAPDPRLEVALNKSWQEMTTSERADERARREETTRALEERIAYRRTRLDHRRAAGG